VKFKLGDRVKINGKNTRINNEKGTVVSKIDPNDKSYAIELDSKDISKGINTNKLSSWDVYSHLEFLPNRIRHEWVLENELIHARIRNTKIARKVHPNYKEDGEWLIIK